MDANEADRQSGPLTAPASGYDDEVLCAEWISLPAHQAAPGAPGDAPIHAAASGAVETEALLGRFYRTQVA